MPNSLIPERAILVSPSLAATIGLEQAILLQHLESLAAFAQSLQRAKVDNGYIWVDISLETLTSQLPFWSAAAIRRVLQQLIDLGMVLTDTFPTRDQQHFAFAINQQLPATQSTPVDSAGATPAVISQAKQPEPANPTDSLGAYRIPAQWQPSVDVKTQLQQRGVSEAFIDDAVDEFVLYWRERNETAYAWSSKFLQHVQRRWEQHQSQLNQRRQETPFLANANQEKTEINQQWQPNIDAIEILERMGINRNFIDDAVAEFVLYWQERGEAQKTWNSKFVSHVKRQWAQFTHTLKHDTESRRIGANWQPDHEVYDVLTIANIDVNFANDLLPEFVLYWKDKNQLHHSWNTKFLQHVKFRWARRDQNSNASKGDAFERLTDRSWAADLM